MGTTQTIFSIAGIVLTLVGLTATYIYFRKNRKYKELSYEILPTLSLISVGAEVRDRVEIIYKSEDGELDDVAIEDLKAVAVTIHNTGTEAVNCKSKDFEDENPQMPVTLDFGQHAQILGEPSTETKPIGRTVHVKRVPGDPGKVLLDTFLLNTRETVTISTFLTDFPEEGKVSVDWHIEGVRQPREIKRERSGLWRSGLWSDITFLLFGIGLTALAAAMTVGIFATGDMGVFVLVPIGITMVFLFGVLAVFLDMVSRG